MRQEVADQAVRDLVQRQMLSTKELQTRYRQAIDQAYWSQLRQQSGNHCEVATLPDTGFPVKPLATDATDEFTASGFFCAYSIFAESVFRQLSDLVNAVRQAGWPAVFSFVFDEFWQLTRCVSVSQLIESALGPGFRQLPHVWTHFVEPGHGAAGWKPHQDGYQRPRRLTIWIPLTDVTVEDSCIYLIPKNQSPPPDWFERNDLTAAEACELLHASRALPAPAGSVLGWDSQVIHWGAAMSCKGKRRVSVSASFVADDVELHADESPLLDHCPALPDFNQRIGVIGKVMQDYVAHDPSLIRFQQLAVQLSNSLH